MCGMQTSERRLCVSQILALASSDALHHRFFLRASVGFAGPIRETGGTPSRCGCDLSRSNRRHCKRIEVDREGILVTLTLPGKLSLRRTDKIVVAVQGLLGDKMIEVKPGSNTAPLVEPGRVWQGVDEPTWDLTHRTVREILSAAPGDRERAIEKWRPWLELNGVIGRPSAP